MQTITVTQFKAHFSEVLDLVQHGEDIAISYGKKKEKIAVLVPFANYESKPQRTLGLLAGKASFSIADDFKTIFIANQSGSLNIPLTPAITTTANGTTTTTRQQAVKAASSTPGALETEITQTFTDKVIQNKDTRILQKDGRIIFLYSFIDEKTLVITTGEKPFEEILKRLHSAKLVR